MTDKLYNGFREGRMPGDYKPNNQVREMTKEQILAKNSGSDFWELEKFGFVDFITKAMHEYADQELAKERERAEKMVSDFDKLAENYKAEGRYVSWAAIKQITGSYRNNLPPETTGNQTAC